MGKKFFLTEDEKMSIRSLYQLNEQEYEEVEVGDDGEEKKMFCNAENTKSLDDIYGDDELHDEMKGIVLVKKNGVKGPFNFYDEPSRKCSKAMDKVIELYKEHEHGEELVKDLEKVYGSHNVSQRAKEFLKHGIDLVKGNLDN